MSARLRRRRALAVAASGVLHLGALLALLGLRADPPAEPAPVFVELAAATPPPPAAAPAERRLQRPTPADASSASPAPPADPPPVRARPAAVVAAHPIAASGSGDPAAQGDGVGEGELSGAARAGKGGGRGCDMVARLQSALRKDPRVQAAVAARAGDGRAVRVWDGDWTASPGQEGLGLAAVREAVLWEVGFAPEACRREPMRGLVLLSLADAPGSGRVVLGAGSWRWSDLLTPRGVGGRAGQDR